MNDRITYSDQITDYLFNEMSVLQRDAFEERMKMDGELSAEVERQRAILKEIRSRAIYEDAMKDPHHEEIDQLAKEIIRKRESDRTRPRKIRQLRRKLVFRMTAAAATVALLWVVHRVTNGLTPATAWYKDSRRSFLESRKQFRELWKKLKAHSKSG